MASWNLYDTFRFKQIEKASDAIDLNTPGGNGFKMALVAAGYTPNQNTHAFFSSITNEVSGTGYAAGGNALGSPTCTMSGAGLVTFDANDPATWTQNAAGFSTARRAIIYRDSGVAGTSQLVAYSDDFGADKGNVGSDLQIILDAAGIFTGPR